MTKKEQTRLLRGAIDRIHFHRTITENQQLEGAVIGRLIAFSEALGRSELIENTKEQGKAEDAAYEILKELP